MNIGIIIHSQTGHTHSAAIKLQKKLSANGHKVAIEQIKPIGNAHPGVKNLHLENYPELGTYEGLVFAAPVWAFTISPVLATYLAQLTSLRSQKIAGFVTMGFPFAWMGGNRAINHLKQICESKGGTVAATAVISLSGKDGKALNGMVEKLSGVF